MAEPAQILPSLTALAIAAMAGLGTISDAAAATPDRSLFTPPPSASHDRPVAHLAKSPARSRVAAVNLSTPQRLRASAMREQAANATNKVVRMAKLASTDGGGTARDAMPAPARAMAAPGRQSAARAMNARAMAAAAQKNDHSQLVSALRARGPAQSHDKMPAR